MHPAKGGTPWGFVQICHPPPRASHKFITCTRKTRVNDFDYCHVGLKPHRARLAQPASIILNNTLKDSRSSPLVFENILLSLLIVLMESKYPMNPNENIRSLHHHSVGSFPQGSYYDGASSFYPSSFRGGVVPHHPAPQEQLTAWILPVDAKNTSIATGAATGAATSTGARSYVPHHDHPYYYYPYQPSIALSRGAYPTNSGGWPSNYHADGFNSSTPYALSAPCASSQFPNHDTSSTTTNPHGTSSVIPTKGAEPRIVTSKKEEDKVVGTANVNAPPTSDTNDTCHTTTNDNACSRNPKVSNQNHNLSSSSNFRSRSKTSRNYQD